MKRETTSVQQVVADKAAQPPAPERVALKQKLAGLEGFAAQSAALVPPDETTLRPPVAPQAPVAARTTEPAAAPPEVEAPDGEVEVAPPPPAAEAAVAAAKVEADRIATQDAAGDKAKAPKGKAKRNKDKPKGGGGLKTNGPEDIVATYGTVAEADKRQGSVQVYWVDGLKTVKKPGRKGKGRKTGEELEGIDQIADPDWDELAKKPKRGKGKGKEKRAQAEVDTEQVAVPKTQSISVHEKLVPTFSAIFQDIKASGDWRNILERPWAHNARQNRNNPTEWSVHSWGTAMDVNPTTNPNAPGAKDYEPSDRQKNIAKHFTSRGFTWLKDSDAMHFQLHSGRTPRMTEAELEGIMADDQLRERDKQYPGTSRESLLRDTKAKMKLVQRDLTKAEKARDKHQAKTPPTKAKALARHERKLADLARAVAKYAWWMAQYQAIVDKLEGVTQAPAADTEPTQAAPAAGEGGPTKTQA